MGMSSRSVHFSFGCRLCERPAPRRACRDAEARNAELEEELADARAGTAVVETETTDEPKTLRSVLTDRPPCP
jgi:hypothetical protein